MDPRWDEMAVVGQIARMHGRHGEVILNVETDFPEQRFRRGAELFINRGGHVSPLAMTSVRFHRGRPIVGFAGVESMDQAEALAGYELRVPPERLVELAPGAFYRHDLVGCQVETSQGETVGRV